MKWGHLRWYQQLSERITIIQNKEKCNCISTLSTIIKGGFRGASVKGENRAKSNQEVDLNTSDSR